MLHNLAGKQAPLDTLINLEQLISDYYDKAPDPGEKSQLVSFGTSGHRGTSSNATFNEKHILAITQAIVEKRAEFGATGPLFMGMDSHALSEYAQRTALEVLAQHSIEVFIAPSTGNERFTPTPAISHAILGYNRNRTAGLADGIVITPSHNPPEDGGLKYNPINGGPAGGEITGVTQFRANEILKSGTYVDRIPYSSALAASSTRTFDYVSTYVSDLGSILDMEAISNCKIAIGADPMGGASLAFWEPIAERFGLNLDVVNKKYDPQFGFMTLDHDGKIRMDCSSPYAMKKLVDMKDKYRVAFGNDTDADRHGIVTSTGGLMNPNHYLSAAIWYLFTHRPGWDHNAMIGKTMVSSTMINRVANKIGRRVKEVPVGFKFFAPGLFDGSLGFGGEESAGASFLRKDGTVWTTDKDGLILDLLAAEMTAVMGKDPSEIYHQLTDELGTMFYTRIDQDIDGVGKEKLKNISPSDISAQTVAGHPVTEKLVTAPDSTDQLGGIKVETDYGWFAARPSGTENKYKIYAESFMDNDHLQNIVEEAQAIVTATIK